MLTEETLYDLVFGVEVLIPIESGLKTVCTDDAFELSQAPDELKEKRDRAAIKMVEYYRLAFR